MQRDQRQKHLFSQPPSLEDIERIAAESYAGIPEALTRHVGNVVFRVEEFPDEDTQDAMQLESPFDLLGLYRGVDLSRKSVNDVASDIDMIFLYRRPLLDYWCETNEDLAHVVRHVLIHEIGHHFGLSDEDMDRIEREIDETR